MAERLQKYLATAGVASRRACETLIEAGRIKVNGIIIRQLGTQVEPGEDVIEFDGRRIEPEIRNVYLMVNKPVNVISAASDPEGRAVVTSLVPPEYGRVYPVGRLDWDTEGAVILTNDGELTQLLTHPRHEVPKIYQAKVRGIVDNMDPRIERLRHGVKLDDDYVTLPADVIRDSDTGNHTWFVVGIREGKNRQIRRMFEAVQLDLIKLRRVAYATVQMGSLQPGELRRLTDAEVDALYEAAGASRDVLKATRGRVPTRQRHSRISASKEAGRALREVKADATGASAPPKRGAKPSARPAPRTAERPGARPTDSRSRTTSPRPGRDEAPSREPRRSRADSDRPASAPPREPRRSRTEADRPASAPPREPRPKPAAKPGPKPTTSRGRTTSPKVARDEAPPREPKRTRTEADRPSSPSRRPGPAGPRKPRGR
jgi:23S rRNA pseudouridine2605 synthase